MARLSAEQWIAARADYEIRGLSQAEIMRKYGVTRGAVSQRVAAENWQAGKTKRLQEKKASAIIALAETEQEAKQTKLNNVERAAFEIAVRDEVDFRLQNDADMEAVRQHVMALLPAVDKPQDAKAVMDTLRIQREARLGKAPDTAIQINNNATPEIEPRKAAQTISGLLAVAQARKDAAARD
ncbi:MAG: hypothetical protein Q4A74_01585 [Cardiobacteriaceae bacterium]|nr:hypothetical protein [Cardiobacteriaceae bacterium]